LGFRWAGFTSFWLMIAHVVLITLGYAGAAHANAFAELWDMIWTYPGMLLATAGTLALIMVVVTSIRVGCPTRAPANRAPTRPAWSKDGRLTLKGPRNRLAGPENR
jgi:hypothetical protein